MVPETRRTRDLIFVIGAPGAGKGTLCKMLAEANNVDHLSLGDLLRQTVSSPNADQLIAGCIHRGELLPTHILHELLYHRVAQPVSSTAGRPLLLDGFPRRLDQAREFEAVFGPPKLILFFDCPEDLARERVITRKLGRFGDTVEIFDKRYSEFRESNPPILSHYARPEGRLITIDTSGATEESYQKLQAALGSSEEWAALTSEAPKFPVEWL